jgi:hypothetical protein
MEDALGPIGAGMIGVAIYAILKAVWWAGEWETPREPPEATPRRSQRIAAHKRLRED